MTTPNTDTSKEHHYAVSRLVDKKEVFFEHKGISYGLGRSWVITPEQRKKMGLKLTTKGSNSCQHKKQNYLLIHELFNTPEVHESLQKELDQKNNLPSDATVSRCEMEPYSLSEKNPRHYSQRNLIVLVLSKSFEHVKDGYRYPDLV